MIDKLELEHCPFCGGVMESMSHLDEKGLSTEVSKCVGISWYLPNYKCKQCYSVILPSQRGLNAFAKKTKKRGGK